MRRLLLVLLVSCLAVSSLAAQLPRVVIVVRHAERASDGTNDPALTPAGEARANALAQALRDARVTAIFATQFRRTQLTAAPLAAATGLTPVVMQAGRDVPAHARAIAEAITQRSAGGAILVVGHSNTVTHIIRALGGPEMPELCDTEYANLFTVIIQPTGEVSLVRGRFGAEDVAPPSCRP